MVGQTVSHYEITEKLGEGGMGVVYKARDTKLDRTVALKFLPAEHTANEENIQRFIREAKAASSLDHPNICTIHEINETDEGQLFIVMPAYEGETLAEKIKSGPLELDEALDIAIQIADGLQAAHEKHIVHRDIKSSNIFITAKDQIKIMDFGLAHKADLNPITKTNITMGTIPYISPEQVRGEKLDLRTDVWSFGVVLYEMITGHLPFRSDYNEVVIYNILKEEPKWEKQFSHRVPFKLEQIVERMLEKNRTARYQTVGDVLQDLKILKKDLDSGVATVRLARKKKRKHQVTYRYAIGFVAISSVLLVLVYFIIYQPQRPIDSIAVLPFENLTGDPAQDYFADAMTEQITSELARLPGLIVVSRSSVMHYRSNPMRPRDVAKELGVQAIVAGSVLRADENYRITVHLIDGRTETHRWSNDFIRDSRELLSLQKDVALAIAEEIRLNLTPETVESLVKLPEVDPAAQRAYLRGMYHLSRYRQEVLSPETIQMSIELFEEAVAIEPNWAEAYAQLAGAYHWSASNTAPGLDKIRKHYQRSKAAAIKAIELDETVADAHGALGFVLNRYDIDWDGAERAYRRALELDPNNHYRWGYAIFLHTSGRYEEAAANYPVMQEPLSGRLRWQLATSLACAGRYDEAVEEIQDFFSSDSWQYDGLLASIDLAQGKTQRAIERLEKHEQPGYIKSMLAYAYAVAGRTEDARQLLTELEEEGYWLPHVYVALGEIAKAILQLYLAWTNRHTNLFYIRCDPRGGYSDLTLSEGLRDHQEFQRLLQQINFPGNHNE